MSDPVLTTSIEPSSPVTAGNIGSWTLRFQATGTGLPGHSTIRVSTDTDTDWGVPQFDDPTAAEYTTVTAPEGVDVAARTVGGKGFQVEIGSGGLPGGGEISVVLGDTSGGGPGSRSVSRSCASGRGGFGRSRPRKSVQTLPCDGGGCATFPGVGGGPGDP